MLAFLLKDCIYIKYKKSRKYNNYKDFYNPAKKWVM